MPSKDEFDAMYASGKMDQLWASARDAASHAKHWFEGNKHLIDPDKVGPISDIVRKGSRGMLTDDEINEHLSSLDATYPPFVPDTSPHLNVPDHLGDQFR